MGHIIVIISYRLSYHIAYIFSTKKHPSISARVPQIPFLYSYFIIVEQRMDNPEGQVTYPIRNRTAGLPTSSSTFLGVHCVFIFVIIIKPYGTINLIRQIQISRSILLFFYHQNTVSKLIPKHFLQVFHP